jgi:sugar fermentation stimulation protein A
LIRKFRHIRKAAFIDRPNRFLVTCSVNGRKEMAHLPNPGKLRELLLPGSTLYVIEPEPVQERKTAYTVVAVEKRGDPVFLDTHMTNQVARHLIEEQKVPGMQGYRVVRPELAVGSSRFDFLLQKGRRKFVLEVKSCTLFGQEMAMFPDAVTTRGRRHLEELAQLTRNGLQGGVLFVIHSPRPRFFMPEHHTDLDFARTLLRCRKELFIRAVGVEWLQDLTLGERVRSLKIPWDLVEQETHDRGSYVVVLRLKRNRCIEIGSLGKVSLAKGYYLYVGSAMRGLGKRIQRHRGRRKKLFWHIDYLRNHAEFCAALPVRSSVPLECEMAGAVRKISEWSVPRFGSSDCSCESHLFGLAENPINNPTFVDRLQYFRIDRLSSVLETRR